jgi:acetylornithine deacetylase/succinyl-diaminopimelate desuccinylase-like protein
VGIRGQPSVLLAGKAPRRVNEEADFELSRVVELLQSLIRNRCVSSIVDLDGLATAGDEGRSAELLAQLLADAGLEVERVELTPGRPAVVARIEGRDDNADSLAYVGHMDVVPADEADWIADPFGGDLIGDEVWGRGALDMLGQLSAMVEAFRVLAQRNFRPRGDLLLLAVPDEECGGLAGTRELLVRRPELCTNFALTEVGGAIHRRGDGSLLIEAYSEEKGLALLDITVRGRSGHSAFPFGSDNALLRLARVVQKLEEYEPRTIVSQAWQEWVHSQDFDPSLTSLLTDSATLPDVLESLPAALAAQAHASTHCALVPTVATAGDKANTIPSSGRLIATVRTPPGQDLDEVINDVHRLLSGLVEPSDIRLRYKVESSRSETDSRLWEVLKQSTQRFYPGSQLLPSVLCAQTDARWLREAGTITYGFGLLSERLTADEYWQRFHGPNERIDIDSLRLSTEGFIAVAEQFCG